MTVAIIGAGLAGLHAAHLLHRAGVDFSLFEARDHVGGRILTVDEQGGLADNGFDLGPSWFWPQMHPVMGELIDELGLPFFQQHSSGDMVFERTPREIPQRVTGFAQEPSSMRLAGGTAAMVRALMRDLPLERLHFGTPVTALRLKGESVEVIASDSIFKASHVIAALPPRLFAQKVTLDPAPALCDLNRWQGTATWMAAHAKFFAVYDRPFWRDAGLSGMAQSMVGPLAEIHDATTASGKAALFGFVGVPAANRAALGDEALIHAAIQQLVRLFGPEVGSPRATLIKDWAKDPWTATNADAVPSAHPAALAGEWVTGQWQGRLFMAGSEASPSDPGYLAGAIGASGIAVKSICG
jgi:monoamine oxidase